MMRFVNNICKKKGGKKMFSMYIFVTLNCTHIPINFINLINFIMFYILFIYPLYHSPSHYYSLTTNAKPD